MQTKRYPSILLASGGIDSFVAYYYLGKPQTVYFNTANRYAQKEIKVVKTLFPDIIVDDVLRLGDVEHEDAHIPFRNLFFAMMVAAKYSDTVYIVGIKDDMMTDKNEAIFKEFSDLLSKLEGRNIQVLSPFWDMTKQDILRWYLESGNDKSLLMQTISCYSEEDTNYCGRCASCFRKWVALWSVGIKLDFHNREMMNQYREWCSAGKYNPERNQATLEVLNEYEKENRH